MIEIVRHTQRNVKRWQDGDMRKRWTAIGMLQTEQQFRRIIGYSDLAKVYYTTAADLVARTARAALDGRWQATMRFWNGPQLLVVDELGYLPRPARTSSKSSRAATSTARSSARPTAASPAGARSLKTPPSPSRSSTDSSTTPPCSRSTATATGCAATAPASNSYAPASTKVGNA
jgi:hypothetical protein